MSINALSICFFLFAMLYYFSLCSSIKPVEIDVDLCSFDFYLLILLLAFLIDHRYR